MLSILKNHTILYVEDEPEIQKNMTEYLQSYFGTVHTASDGEDALKQYNTHNPDVLLLDINIPLVDGLSVAKTVRQTDNNARIIMLTAHTETERLLSATELNLTKYLVKPITPKLFKETLLVLAKELLISAPKFLNIGKNCVWDQENETLFINNEHTPLPEKEYKLLKLLINKKGCTTTYVDIMIAVWEDAYERDISIDSVKNQIRNLRKRLPKDCIDSIYGKGYMLK